MSQDERVLNRDWSFLQGYEFLDFGYFRFDVLLRLQSFVLFDKFGNVRSTAQFCQFLLKLLNLV